jgi:hypothetical protein
MRFKNITCPECNREWMWADWVKPEKAICPEGYGCKEVKPQEPTISELFDELLDRLDDIEKKIDKVMELNKDD